MTFDAPVQSALAHLAGWYVFGLGMPMLVARLWKRLPGSAVGLCLPRRGGRAATIAGVALTLPVGFWLAIVTPDPWAGPLVEFLDLMTIVPEHCLFFGIGLALLMPHRRLEWPAAAERRTWEAVFAVGAVATLFGFAHVGKAGLPELVASFPLGVAFAWMTVRTASLWPAIVAHAALNLIPMAVMAGAP